MAPLPIYLAMCFTRHPTSVILDRSFVLYEPMSMMAEIPGQMRCKNHPVFLFLHRGHQNDKAPQFLVLWIWVSLRCPVRERPPHHLSWRNVPRHRHPGGTCPRVWRIWTRTVEGPFRPYFSTLILSSHMQHNRQAFIWSSICHLYSTTYETTDELSISALNNYLAAAVPQDKFEDFDVAEIVRTLASLRERGEIVLVEDIIKLV